MNPTRVLHVIPALSTGGAEGMLASLVTAERNPLIESIVVALKSGGELADPIRAAGIELYELGMRGPADLPSALFRLTWLIRRIRPAAVQSWLYYADLMSLWALELSGHRGEARLYWGVRCSDMDQRRYGAMLRWAIAACAKRARKPNAVIANSFAGRAVHQNLGYAPHAFAVIPNGIDTARFRPDVQARQRIRSELGIPEQKPVVIHAARVDPMKDHNSLMALATALPDIDFVATGAGTQSLRTPANVRTLGVRRDMPALYAAADIALSTSAFGEGFSNFIAEAMATGLPAVATDTGDARQIVGDTGTIAAPRDISTLMAAIQRLTLEPDGQRRERSLVCRTRVERHFSLDRCVAAFDMLHRQGTLPADPSIAA